MNKMQVSLIGLAGALALAGASQVARAADRTTKGALIGATVGVVAGDGLGGALKGAALGGGVDDALRGAAFGAAGGAILKSR